MGFVGLAVLGVFLGAAGSEVLRAKKPEFVEKVEDAAKRLVDRYFSSKTADEETKEESG